MEGEGGVRGGWSIFRKEGSGGDAPDHLLHIKIEMINHLITAISARREAGSRRIESIQSGNDRGGFRDQGWRK